MITVPVQSLGTTVNGPGQPSGGYDYLAAFLAAGGGGYADIIAWHGYPTDPGTNSQSVYLAKVQALTAMLAQQGQGQKPLWNTEYSSNSGTAATDETYLAATSIIASAQNVARTYFYAYDSAFDLLWLGPNVSPPSGALNVAGVGYQTIVGWLKGATVISPLIQSGVVWSINLMLASGSHALVAWTTDGSTPSFNVPNWANQYAKLDGTTVPGLGSTVALSGLSTSMANVLFHTANDSTGTAIVLGQQTMANSLAVVIASDQAVPSASYTYLLAKNPTSILTRPANTTPYTSGKLIASNTTAGSIVVPSYATSFGGGMISRVRLLTNATSGWNHVGVSVNLWAAAPTYTNGDGGTYAVATGAANWLGNFTGALTQFGDGAIGACPLSVGNEAVFELAGGFGASVFWDLEILSAATPISGQTFTLIPEQLD